MSTAGRFIISLDCEGKWGLADQITDLHERNFTQANLARAYGDLVALFARYEIPATFAFVMAFVLNAGERELLADRLVDVTYEGRNWLRFFREAERAGRIEGWFCPEALDLVQAAPHHEIACHGFCHVPLREDGISASAARQEMAACLEVAKRKNLSLKTFVHPRGLLGHFAEIAAAGFTGYRDSLSGRGGRIANLAREFAVFEHAQTDLPSRAGMTVIPSGRFLNWQHGPRKLVPRAVSRLRWRHILEDASETGRVAHIWLHPHNLISAPGTIERLDDVLREAARLRDAGRITILTQAEYVASQRGA